ncbi:hypothetical protein [Cellulomonas oligotrophica]|uniref:DUF5666 domain-containing protein n=1 Tax=Cellulomonas oligotrophica TaxID=931536 RepID=A0A7Y9FE04_9CELL|nr:hypothetical protein [Cellulomonas oligotrophica]NYD85616.1 hypothetical protein [Cellulomonas oligotrophica]GIG31375.1 hypothetical protein Col01nite_05340 [Cellulomonas oligotrophica]
MHTDRPTSTRRLRTIAAGAPVAALALLLAACGSDASATTDATTSATTAAPDAQPGAGFGGGTSGEVVVVDGSTMQVQGTDTQTAVTWDDATTFTQTVDASLADVTTDVCVTVVTGEDGAAATSVAISDPVDDACTAGFGGGGMGGGTPGEMPTGMPEGEMPDGAPTAMPEGEMPEGAPTDMPEGGFGGGGFGGGTTGLVTAVDGSTLTVAVTSQDGSSSTAQITVDDATTYTRTAEADATAVVVGECATVQGEADDSGTVAATSVAVTSPTDEGCTTGFMGRGGAGERPGTAEEGSDA